MNKNTFFVFLAIIIGVNATGLFNDIFTGDSALYATISKSFHVSGDYSNIYVHGKDWLDKPHFPFWLCAASMKLLGVNTFAYKLPSLLFFLIGLLYTYKLARSLYNTQTAYWATLILGSSFHLIISNNDTRAESILLGLVMGATYYLFGLTRQFSLKNLLLTAVFGAAAVMTKGLFVLIIPYSAVLGNLAVQGQLKTLLSYKWLFPIPLTLIFTFPEFYALYQQFDSNPDVIVFDKKGVSGIQYFLWDSQFGRFVGQFGSFINIGPIKEKGDILYFLHTFVWAYAPWAVIGLISLFKSGLTIFRDPKNKEYLCFFGFSVMFVIFSLSSFQLSHYLNIIFPFISIIVAAALVEAQTKKRKVSAAKISFNVYAVFFISSVGFHIYILNPGYNLWAITLGVILSTAIYIFNFSKIRWRYPAPIYGLIIIIIGGIYMNTYLYPTILKYQSGAQAAFYSNEMHKDKTIVAMRADWLLEYYADSKFVRAYSMEDFQRVQNKSDVIIYTNEAYLSEMTQIGIDYNIIKSFDHFHITELSLKFINYRTRESEIEKRYLISID